MEFLNAGSLVRVAELTNCADEPTVYTLETSAAAAIGDDSISLFLDPAPAGVTAPSVLLTAGSKLYFGATFIPVTIAEDIKITATTSATAQTVIVDELTQAVALGASANTWAMISVASPTDIPLNLNTNTVDRQDLTYGLQGSMVTTSVDLQSQLAFIATADDAAIWQVIYPYTQSGKDFFCYIARSGDLRAWGRCKGSNISFTGATKEISRGSVQLMFQSAWAAPSRPEYLSVSQKATYDTVARLAGV